MPKPRSQQISLLNTPFYHIFSRTVRKAFLCGVHKETGVSFEHRRIWIEKRIFELSQVFAIDICALIERADKTIIILPLLPALIMGGIVKWHN